MPTIAAAPALIPPGKPYDPADFQRMRVTDAWKKYGDRLTWGRGQTLAVLDDGFDVTEMGYDTVFPWGKQIISTWDAVAPAAGEDCAAILDGYHGTSVIYPSALHGDKVGVAFNAHLALVHACTVVHLRRDESASIARALQWVIDHRRKFNITTVNLAMLDDQPHPAPLPTVIDDKLALLRELGVWVSSPCGNNEHTNGISWPACQDHCFGIGATRAASPQDNTEIVHRDRFKNTDILAPSTATSSSNAYIAAAAMILREAIEKTGYDWRQHGPNMPEALMAIFLDTGAKLHDPVTGLSFKRLDVLAALDQVMESKVKPPTRKRRM